MANERMIMVPEWLVEEAVSLIEKAGLSGTGVSMAAPRLRAALAQPAAGEPTKSKHRQEMDKLRQEREQSMAAPPAAAPVVAGEPVAWIVVEEPFHGVQGIQSGEWDIELDAKAIESLAQDNSPGRIALFTAALPAAAHGEDVMRKDERAPGLEWAINRCAAMQNQGFERVRLDAFKRDLEVALDAMRAQAGEGGE